MRIGVDIMSGETDVRELLAGCVDAVIEKSDFEVVLYGKSSVYTPILEAKQKELASRVGDIARIKIVEASEVITMHDDPLTVMKQKKDASMIKGLNEHKEGLTNAFFSPGNTGALVLTSALIVGRVKGLKKPALTTYMPNMDAKANIVLDVGASAECEVDDLVRFAVMGRIYSKEMLGVANPRVGLLNIGVESHKGTQVLKNTYKKMSEMDINFIGNVEGRDLFGTNVDVIVCDGHVGNIALKTAEGAGKLTSTLLKRYIKEDIVAALSSPLYKKALTKMKAALDPELYGGVPLLGVNGNVFKGHGSSGRNAIKYGILAAANSVRTDVLGKINHQMKEFHLA